MDRQKHRQPVGHHNTLLPYRRHSNYQPMPQALGPANNWHWVAKGDVTPKRSKLVVQERMKSWINLWCTMKGIWPQQKI